MPASERARPISNAAAPVRAQRLVCHLSESNQTVAMLAGGTKTPMAWKTSHLYGASKSQPVSLYALVIHAAADAIPITAIANTIDVSFIASPLLVVPLLPKPPVSKRLQSIVRVGRLSGLSCACFMTRAESATRRTGNRLRPHKFVFGV